MKRYIITLLLNLLALTGINGKHLVRLDLPNREMLSSGRVMQVMQDSEGYLWYATDGGGVCRDNGREMLVLRSDAEHPDLLGNNSVACMAEAGRRYILIGTSHGAYILDKKDYSIRRLTEVDDKRVDDIIVGSNGHWWLTANKKVYEYSDESVLLNTYSAGDKYLARLHEDRHGQLWASQWNGALIKLEGGEFVHAAWPLNVATTAIDDDPSADALLIGTIGKGVVRYHPDSGTVELTEPSDSFCISRTTTDLQGRMLVADISGECYALADSTTQQWRAGQRLTRYAADSILTARGLSARPTAVAENREGELWFSTGRDIRRMKDGKETVVLGDTKDVSAMTFTDDGTLWLATIFGTLMTYRDAQLTVDKYASNEYGDAVTHIATDSTGRLTLVSERYIRIYDYRRGTLRQQSLEAAGVYSIELQETQPGRRWSQPPGDTTAQQLPQWVWWTLAVLCMILSALIVHIRMLHRQRERFLTAIRNTSAAPETSDEGDTGNGQDTFADEWLQSAIAQVEAHMSDDSYSVEQLARDMCMSRMTFYRKIQSATGQKPSEFMRTIRLRRAAELLREDRLSITEISYDTGFSSVSYFSRCFRTMYGVPPTLFGKTTTADSLSSGESPS